MVMNETAFKLEDTGEEIKKVRVSGTERIIAALLPGRVLLATNVDNETVKYLSLEQQN
jgi:hypothetical protein